MKRFLTAGFATMLLAGSVFAAIPAHAQFVTQNADGSYSVDSNALQQATDQAASQDNQNLIQQTNQAASNVANSASNEATASLAPDSSAARNTPSAIQEQNSTDDSGYDSIMTWIMRLFAWLVGVGAITLDNAAYYTVIHMGCLLNSATQTGCDVGGGGLSAVGVAWRILRDIGNIILLFGFLAIGIATILNVQTYGARRMLPMLLISAVLLNFSLFIAEAVIDVGNLFATEFFVQINDGQVPGPVSYSTANVHNEGISNKIMAQVGLQTMYNASLPQNKDLLKSGNLWIVGFMAIILFLIAAFVMFSLAFVLIARFVFLLLLIVVAPVGIAGLAIPKLDKYANMWWSKLFEQTITAPVLMLMLYVALAVITDANFLTGFGITRDGASNAWVAFLNNGNGDVSSLAGMILAFLVAMGLLLAVTILSKSMSAFGASAATKWGGRLSFGVTAATAGFVGRRTVGRASNYTARKIRSSGFGRTDLGRLAAGVADRGAKGTYDFRGVKVVSQNLKSAGIDAGSASKTSYQKIEKQAIEDRTKHAKTLELTRKEQADKARLEQEQKDNKASKDSLKLAQDKAKEDHAQRIKDANGYQEAIDETNRLYEEETKRIEEERKRLDADAARIKTDLGKFNNLPQKQYAENLQKGDSLKKAGTYINAAGFGTAVGAAHAMPVAAAVGLGAGAAVAGGVGAAGFGAYLASAAPRANKAAAEKILKEAKKGKGEKQLETVLKAIENGTKEGGGEEKKEKDKEEKDDEH